MGPWLILSIYAIKLCLLIAYDIWYTNYTYVIDQGFNTWAEATRQAQDISKWRGSVMAPFSTRRQGTKWSKSIDQGMVNFNHPDMHNQIIQFMIVIFDYFLTSNLCYRNSSGILLTCGQPIISLEMPVPTQGHYGFHSFPVVDWFCLFI
jgi:hypothetical protein